MKPERVVVCGGGGFIGGHLVADLLRHGKKVRSVDVKPFSEWFQMFPEAENLELDLREKESCERAAADVDLVYNLAADMGGMGFIENNKALCMLSVLINTHLLMAAKDAGARRFFYASSACVYAADKQTDPDVTALKEDDAYSAMPEDGYGWEKLFSERMCCHFREDFGLTTRVARYHNVYGPHGTYDSGREKAPAAICRKVIEAKLPGKAFLVSNLDQCRAGDQNSGHNIQSDSTLATHPRGARHSTKPVPDQWPNEVRSSFGRAISCQMASMFQKRMSSMTRRSGL